MTEITHRFVDVNGLRMHVAEAGIGPLVLLPHGFPECWYSRRHQLPALADARSAHSELSERSRHRRG